MLTSLVLTGLILGCGGHEAASSAGAHSSAPLAKRWRPPPPRDALPDEAQPQERDDRAKSEAEPSDDPREPARPAGGEPAHSPQDQEDGGSRPTMPRAIRGPSFSSSEQAKAWTPTSSTAAGEKREPGVITLRTDDCDTWPSYDWPLELHIEVPTVPEGITKPAPPVPDH